MWWPELDQLQFVTHANVINHTTSTCNYKCNYHFCFVELPFAKMFNLIKIIVPLLSTSSQSSNKCLNKTSKTACYVT